ncbi:hypothetical protein GQ53DRAFT_846441 [Thozetella sp. PMI_491]|nr:hypothetical protein GQ53DRAFT_846441 [Thozetella sp. PMI_491]
MAVIKSSKLSAIFGLDIKKQVKTDGPGALADVIGSWDEEVANGSELQLAIPPVQGFLASARRVIVRHESYNMALEPDNLPVSVLGGGAQDHTMDFNRDIKILAADGSWALATALLDTQCQVGNWISWRLVQRLGKLSQISTNFTPPQLVEASGRPIRACGVIKLNWKWQPRGTRTHECQFYVFPGSMHLDVLFGVDFILSENLLRVDESVIVPLVEHKKPNKAEKAAVARAKQRQREEKAALKERKRQAKENASEQGESFQGGEQQGS